MYITYAYYSLFFISMWGVIVKKMSFQTLKKMLYVLPFIHAITAKAADYTRLFEGAQQSFAHFENRGENPMRCVVRASISGICGPGEVKTFQTDIGFSYVGPDGKRYKQFSLDNSSNPTSSAQHTLPYAEDRPLILAPGEQTDIQLSMLSHFLGLSHFQEQVGGVFKPHSKFISWEVKERGLNVLLGSSRPVQTTIDHTTVKTTFDERGLPIFVSPQHELNWTLDRLKTQQFRIQNNTARVVNLDIVLKQIYGSWPHQPIPDTLYANPGFAIRVLDHQKTDGTPVFKDIVYTSKLTNTIPQGKTPFFQSQSLSLQPGQSYELNIPYGFISSATSENLFSYSFNNNQFKLNINDTLSIENRNQKLFTILMQEYKERGKEFYEGFEALWERHRIFIQTFYENAGISLDQVMHKRRIMVERSKRAITDALIRPSTSQSKIPLIMHKVWITADDNPYEVNTERLDHYLEQASRFPEFKHMFWVKDKSKLPITEYRIWISGLAIEIHELNEIWPEFRGKDIYARYEQNKRFTALSDLTRFNLLYLFGGVYADFGIEYHISPSFLCKYFDFFACREGPLVGTSTLASRKNGNILNNLLTFIDNIDSTPHHLRNIGDGNHVVPWTALCILTVYLDLYHPESDKILLFPWSKGMFSSNAQGSWISAELYGQKSIIKTSVTEQEYFGDDIVSIENGYNYQPSRWDEHITHEMSRILFGKSREDIAIKRRQLMETSKATYYQLFPQSLNVIPHISHRCWLTNPNNPFETPKDKLDYYIASCKTLNISTPWQHFFWCLDPTKIPETIAYLQQSNIGIVIKSLSEIYPRMQARHVFNAYLQDGRYTNANDLSRMEVLNIYGGFYCDIGIELNKDMTSIIDNFEYLCLHNKTAGHLDLGLIGLPPHSRMSEAYLHQAANLPLLPDEAKAITPTSELQFCWLGCNYWMSYLDSQMPSDTKVFLVEYSSPLINLHRLQSWGVTPSFGNKSIKDSTLNLFSVNKDI
jgi:mannosyltransferase OCH1-like enzyme